MTDENPAPPTPPPLNASHLMGIGEAAEILNVGPQTVRRWCDKRMIKSITYPSGHRRVFRDEIAAILTNVQEAEPADES